MYKRQALDGIPGKKTVMESTANHIAFNFIIGRTGLAVSYTHLDVYKRQGLYTNMDGLQ